MSARLRLDLHVHSRFSPDSRLALEAAVEAVSAAGLQGFALTDHNTVAGHARLRELRSAYPRLWFLPGVEVSAREGHLLLYGVDSTPPPGASVAEVVEWAEPRNAVAVLAHPYRWVHGVGARVAKASRVAGIEARNGHTSETANTHAELLAARRALATTGGSDAHDAASVGRAYTELPEEPSTVDDILEAIRHHRSAVGGESLSAPGRVWLAVRNGVLRARRGFRPV